MALHQCVLITFVLFLFLDKGLAENGPYRTNGMQRSMPGAVHLSIDDCKNGTVSSVAAFHDDVMNNRSKKYFRYEAGNLTLLRNGLYLVIAQITFQYDPFDNNSVPASVSIVTSGLQSPLAACGQNVHSTREGPALLPFLDQCQTTAVSFLRKGDTLGLRFSMGTGQIVCKRYLTFWQVLKL